MRISLVFLILAFQFTLQAQTTDSVKVVGQISLDSGIAFKPDKTEVRLVPYAEGENISLTQVNSDGSFVIKVGVKNVGMYDLKYKNYKVTLLLTSAEPVCKVIIKADIKMDVKSMKIAESKENDAYRIFKRENAAFKELLANFRADCEGNDKNCSNKYKKQLPSQNELMEYLKNGYKGTFTASVLANLGIVPELNGKGPLLAQMQSEFFDACNFSDPGLYITPDLNNKIAMYLDYLADTSASGRLAFISGIMAKTKGNKAAQKNLLTTLFNSFLDDYREPYIESLVQWAQSQTTLDADQPVLAAKLKLVGHVLPGVSATDVKGNNLEGQPLSLLNTTKANRLTLLVFWESDCPHCRKAMPELIRLYKQYHTKGFEVFAASLDSDKDKWKKFIDDNKLNWTNILLPERSSVHSDYFIQYTPTVVLIDDKGHIVRRFLGVEDLDKAIGGFLSK